MSFPFAIAPWNMPLFARRVLVVAFGGAIGVGAVVFFFAAAAGSEEGPRRSAAEHRGSPPLDETEAGASAPFRSLERAADFATGARAGASPGETEILHPPALGKVRTGITDLHGRAVGVSCSSCHDALPDAMADRPADLDAFHTDLSLDHGHLGCGACHDESDRDALRLVEGETIPFEAVNQLCGQCHGSEHRSYRAGAHGGMQGYWDERRGGRERLSCVGCHDPHEPAFPLMMPAPPPRDRFFEPDPPSQRAPRDPEEP